MNQVALADSVWSYFGTSSASTGAATNADSTPTVVVAEDGADMGYAPTVTNVATGLYKAEIVASGANGFEAGRRYNLYAVATVGGITGRDGIGEFEVLAVDLNTGVGSVTGAVGSVTGNVGGNVVGSVASVTAGVTLAADAITAATIASGAIGSSEAPLLANLDATVSSRLATAGYTAPDNASIAAILVDTAEIGAAGAGLTNINLPNQTMDITGNITGNLSGSVGSVTGLTAANLDVAVSTRLSSAGYTAPDNTSVAAILVDTAAIDARLPSDPADQSLIIAATNAIIADTDDIQTRLPAALVGGRIDATVGAMQANVVTAAAIATDAIDADALANDAVAELVDAVWAKALETGFTADRLIRTIAAAVAGKVSGGPGSPVFRNVGDTVDQITGVADSSGNRTTSTIGA